MEETPHKRKKIKYWLAGGTILWPEGGEGKTLLGNDAAGARRPHISRMGKGT